MKNQNMREKRIIAYISIAAIIICLGITGCSKDQHEDVPSRSAFASIDEPIPATEQNSSQENKKATSEKEKTNSTSEDSQIIKIFDEDNSATEAEKTEKKRVVVTSVAVEEASANEIVEETSPVVENAASAAVAAPAPAAEVSAVTPATTEVVTVPAVEASATESSNGGTSAGDASRFDTYNNVEQQQTTETWVLNTSSMKIHYPGCKSVPKIAPHNYATSSKSEAELLAAGYTTCGNCH